VNSIGSGENAINIFGSGIASVNYFGSALGSNSFIGSTTFENVTSIYDLLSIRSTTSEATTTSLFANVFRSINGFIDNFTSTNATITNATTTNLFSEFAKFDQASSTYLYAQYFRSENISGNFATMTAATFTNLRADSFFTSNFGFENVFASVATVSDKLSVGGPFNVNAPFKVNFVDNATGTSLGDSAFAMTNLSTTNSNTNAVLRLNSGADGSTCSLATPSNCIRFLEFFADSSDEVTGTGRGRVVMNQFGGVGYETGAADFGEYLILDEPVEFGDVISKTYKGNVKSNKGNLVLGVISDNAGFIGNSNISNKENAKVVGYLGVIRTKVSTEYGEIKKGDPIGVGSIPGVGTKMTRAGYIVGHAIESYNGQGIGKIEVQIAPTWYDPSVLLSGESISTTTVQNILSSGLNDSFASTTLLVNSLTNSINNSIDNTVNRILSERNFTPATSTVNTLLDQVFVYAFSNSTSTNLLDVTFAATTTEGLVERFSFVDMQFFVLRNIDELNKKVDIINNNVLTIANIVTDKLTAKEIQTDKLCIGNTCINEQDLKDFINYKQNQVQTPTQTVPETSIETIVPISETSTEIVATTTNETVQTEIVPPQTETATETETVVEN
jgi:hypothetical protein